MNIYKYTPIYIYICICIYIYEVTCIYVYIYITLTITELMLQLYSIFIQTAYPPCAGDDIDPITATLLEKAGCGDSCLT